VTTTSTALKVYARLDERDCLKKVQVPDDQLAAVNLTPDPFDPEWNYSIRREQPSLHHSIRQIH
jgi:Rhodopirellula transposase DDE domain